MQNVELEMCSSFTVVLRIQCKRVLNDKKKEEEDRKRNISLQPGHVFPTYFLEPTIFATPSDKFSEAWWSNTFPIYSIMAVMIIFHPCGKRYA